MGKGKREIAYPREVMIAAGLKILLEYILMSLTVDVVWTLILPSVGGRRLEILSKYKNEMRHLGLVEC